MKRTAIRILYSLLLLAASSLTSHAQLIWACGTNDNAWPLTGTDGGPAANFVQENGSINDLPGSPDSTPDPRGADNDYYFAGLYTKALPSVVAAYMDYTPIGEVAANENAAERAFAAADNDLRYHFNLPTTLRTNDLLTLTWDPLNLHTDGQADPRYGVEVYFNGVLVQTQIVVRPSQLNRAVTTPSFSLASVNARTGPGHDNIVSLRGINYNAEGGGNWMGVDYVQLNKVDSTPQPPKSPFPWAAGRDDNAWPLTGSGGAANAAFVQENGAISPLPGSPVSTKVAQGADNDYYFGGVYSNTIASVVARYGAYTPVGLVATNEEAAERAFASADNDLRFHFNLPSTLKTNDLLTVGFDALNLHTDGQADPRYGIEVYFNGVLVQPQIVIRPAQLDTDYTTPPFSLASVNAQVGLGFDNIVSLRGINYNAEGGGNWMGIDYVQLKQAVPPPTFPWAAGMNDNAWPLNLPGGGTNAAFVQENGFITPLPGSAGSTRVSQGADNDYYFAGVYTNIIASITNLYPAYTPIGEVYSDEDAAERAFAGADNDLRFHFNLPRSLGASDLLSVTFDPLNLHTDGQADPRYGIEVYFNGILVQTQLVIRPPDLNMDFTTPEFTAASVNARTGPGFDNVVSLKGINYNADGGGNWMGIDYVQLNARTVERLEFVPPVVSGGRITLDWKGTGNLESATAVTGPWTPITPAPSKPYSEAILSGQNRFYRLRR